MTTAAAEVLDDGVKLIAFGSAGVSEGVARQAEIKIGSAIGRARDGVRLRAVRFLPSTRSNVPGGDSFEVLANTTIEVGPHRSSDSRPPRLEVIETVVTIEDGAAGQKVAKISIPSLDTEAD